VRAGRKRTETRRRSGSRAESRPALSDPRMKRSLLYGRETGLDLHRLIRSPEDLDGAALPSSGEADA